MLLSRILHRFAVVFTLSMTVCAGAAEKDITALLPRYAALVAGVDLCALNSHAQGGEIFDAIQSLSDVPLDIIHQAVFACDAAFRRRVSAVSLIEAEEVGRLLKKLEHRKTTENVGSEPVYLINSELNKRSAVRLMKLDDRRLGVYFKFPADQHFEPDRSGIPDVLEKIVPRRSGVLGFIAGIPQSQRAVIRNIVNYYAALESGVDEELILHGKIIFKSNAAAAAARICLPNAVALMLLNQSQISIADTLKAFASLNLRREKNIIYFSCKEFVPLLKIFISVTHGKIPSIQAVLNETQR